MAAVAGGLATGGRWNPIKPTASDEPVTKLEKADTHPWIAEADEVKRLVTGH